MIFKTYLMQGSRDLMDQQCLLGGQSIGKGSVLSNNKPKNWFPIDALDLHT